MFVPRPKKHSLKSSQRYFLILCFIVFLLIIIYILYQKNSKQIIYEPIDIHFHIKYSNIRNSTLKNDLKFEQKSLFQNLIPDSYYPHLPIHIFTQNISSSLKIIPKLILLGNGWFGDAKWGIGAVGKSSKELMTQLSCPFLSDYCDITTDKSLFPLADAVVYHMRDEINLYEAKKYRQINQRFIFALWESPMYTPDLKPFNGFFNWTMTYRFKSHILATYFYTSSYIHKSNNYYQYMIKENITKNLNLNFKHVDYQLSDEILAKKKLGTVAALISNCGSPSRRLQFILRLRRYIDVKIYGQCGSDCPENVNCREFISKNYYFFLSFENSLCTEYTTEKFFTTLEYSIVPIVYGRTNYSYFIPSSGFIDINDFTNISSLAKYINETRYNKEKYLSYFSWKKDYIWGLTHLLTPFCDLCLRLHLDLKPNIIENIDSWWNENACEVQPRKFQL